MIGGLMYLTASRPDIAFATFDSGFELIAYSEADLTGCLDDYKSTSRGLFPAVYLEPFWKIVCKVPDTKDTIRFTLDTQEITYIVDMFCDTLKLPEGNIEENAFYVPMKDVIQYPHFTKLIIADLMKKFPSIPLRLRKDYHSIKDDIPLEICTTDDYKEYEMVFVNAAVPMNQPQSVISTKGMHRFAASMIHDDVDDSGDRIEPESHKEHPKVVVDDDDNKEEKKDEKEGDEMGSLETRTEKMKTPITTTPGSHRINLSLDKNIAQEFTDTVSLSTATTSKDPHKKQHISSKYNHLPGALGRMCTRQGYMIRDMERKCVTTNEFWKVHGKVDQVLHEIVPQLSERAINDLNEGNLKRVVADTIIQERDAF
ncbi:hypothetical protein Tco_1202102 [Tanacetum coccineum]